MATKLVITFDDTKYKAYLEAKVQARNSLQMIKTHVKTAKRRFEELQRENTILEIQKFAFSKTHEVSKEGKFPHFQVDQLANG